MARGTAIAAIDLGSTKIATIVGDTAEGGMLRILGAGVVPSAGIEKGQISSIGQATAAIVASIEKAERASGTRILSAGVSVSGAHLASLNNRGIVAVPDAGRPISADDAQRVIDAARNVSLKSNRELMHALPRFFVVDGQDRVSDPVGMHGQRLDVEMHIVTGGVNALQNVMKCVEGANVQVEALIAAPVATSAAVLDADEQQEGVVSIDIGGGTTDIAVHLDGAIVHTAALPIGGSHVTRDLVAGLRCPFMVAEQAKTRYGAAISTTVPSDETVALTAFGQDERREVHRRLIAEIVEARIEEILSMALVEVQRAGHVGAISAGMVISGGTAELEGLTALAEARTGLPARIGQVPELYGLADQVAGPAYASSLGVLRWMTDALIEPNGQPVRLRMPAGGSVLGLVRGVGRLGRVFLPQ
ncbi:MAG: cell division protein FtsA [Chloroflexi bacterium]|nr:MAG: cell division protein FtsA [Chloroflexota bacterium]